MAVETVPFGRNLSQGDMAYASVHYPPQEGGRGRISPQESLSHKAGGAVGGITWNEWYRRRVSTPLVPRHAVGVGDIAHLQAIE